MQELDEFLDELGKTKMSTDLVSGGVIPQVTEPTLIVGRPGIGKTLFALNLALSLATGSKLLGLQCQKVKVACYFLEGNKQSIGQRIKQLLPHYPTIEPCNLFIDVRSPIHLAQHLPQFANEVKGCQAVIFDPLKNLVEGDYCKPSDATRFLHALERLAKQCNFTPILCHHIRKPDIRARIDPEDIFQLKGAGDYAEVANSILIIEKAKQPHGSNGHFAKAPPGCRAIYFAKIRDATQELPPLVYSISDLVPYVVDRLTPEPV